MNRYIPMPAYPDMMPVDISFVFESERPAGKHGFVRAEGDELRFEDGTLARFWGCNVNGGACFPSREYAPKVARRMAMAGCNIIRFHQLDAEWDTPNLFSYYKGKRVATTRAFDPRSIDALDYFIHCLKEEGIYVYLDMLTYRKFKEGDGLPEHAHLRDKAAPWCISSPELIELQKEFATQIWSHVNPYTGLAYKDEPAIVLTEIVNECDLFYDNQSGRPGFQPSPYYIWQFREMFRDWLQEQGMEYDWEHCDIYTKDTTMVDFKIHVTKKYFNTMRDHMRAIGVKIPITGTNWTRNIDNIFCHQDMDFTDSHHYHYDWKWTNYNRICQNRSITSYPYIFPSLARMRVANKPFFVSEWDAPWPNNYRAEGPIYYAAVAALQNWSGLTIHTYSYNTRLEDMTVIGKEMSTTIAGVPHREGIFSTWNDPAKFGLFYHAALMLRRSDISPADKKVAVSMKLYDKNGPTFNNLLEQHRAASAFGTELPENYDEIVDGNQPYPRPEPGFLRSDNGQMWRDLNKMIGVIDTPRTKVFYGHLGRGNMSSSSRVRKSSYIDTDTVSVDCITDFAVVAMSSLTDEPIHKTDNILLTTIGRARNTDMLFDGEKLLDVGKPPILAEVIEADVKIKTEHGQDMKVWGINAEGYYSGQVVTTYEDGYLCFHLGDEANASCYYLIVKE